MSCSKASICFLLTLSCWRVSEQKQYDNLHRLYCLLWLLLLLLLCSGQQCRMIMHRHSLCTGLIWNAQQTQKCAKWCKWCNEHKSAHSAALARFALTAFRTSWLASIHAGGATAEGWLRVRQPVQSITHSLTQSISQPINQSINQSIIQSVNHC